MAVRPAGSGYALGVAIDDKLRSEYMRRRDDLEVSPHLALHSRLLRFQDSIRIYRANRDELVATTQRQEFTLAGPRRPGEPRDAARERFLEVARLVLNFTASATALVDHTRNFLGEDYLAHEAFSEFESRKKAVSDAEVVQFVQGMRNYCIHAERLRVGAKTSGKFGPDGRGTLATVVNVHTAKMIAYRGMGKLNAKARAYAAARPDPLPLLPVIQEYDQTVSNFHVWLFERLGSVHHEELAQLRQMEDELMDLQRRAFP